MHQKELSITSRVSQKLLLSTLPILLVCSAISPVFGQNPESREEVSDISKKEHENLETSSETKTAVINFFARVNNNSISNLISVTHDLMREDFDEILLVLNTGGGSLDAGMIAYNHLSSLPITLRTHNISNTSSSGVLLHCAGDIRTASDNSRFLIHRGTNNFGNQSYTLPEIDGLYEYYQIQLASKYKLLANCIDSSSSEIERIAASETVLSAREAERFGLVDEIKNISDIISKSSVTINILE